MVLAAVLSVRTRAGLIYRAMVCPLVVPGLVPGVPVALPRPLVVPGLVPGVPGLPGLLLGVPDAGFGRVLARFLVPSSLPWSLVSLALALVACWPDFLYP